MIRETVFIILYEFLKIVKAVLHTRQAKNNHNPCFRIQQYLKIMLSPSYLNIGFVNVALLRVQVSLLQKEARNSFEKRSKLMSGAINESVRNTNRQMALQ